MVQEKFDVEKDGGEYWADEQPKGFGLIVFDYKKCIVAYGRTNDKDAWMNKVRFFKERFQDAEYSRDCTGNEVTIKLLKEHVKQKD